MNPAWAQSRGGDSRGLVRKLVLLAFAVIQLILVGRILLDLGVIAAEGAALDYLVPWSDALGSPVKGMLGGGGIPGLGPGLGGGLNAAMLAALFGWTIVEGLVLRVVGKFAAV